MPEAQTAPAAAPHNHKAAHPKLAPVWRAVIENGFIIFLFYSNLLMGEFTRSNDWQGKTLLFGLRDILTRTNFTIAVISALIGYSIVEVLRRRV